MRVKVIPASAASTRRAMIALSVGALVAAFASCKTITSVIGGNEQPVQTKLEKVAARGDSARLAILFIHGIFSDGVGGWTNSTSKEFFPRMLCTDEQIPNVTCFTATYFSPKFRAAGSLDEVARQVEREVVDGGIFRDYKHVVIVGHSMGGLIARKLAVGLNTVGNARALQRLRGVLTLATPSGGAPIAVVGKYLLASRQLPQLDPRMYHGWLSDLDKSVGDLKQERDDRGHFFPRFLAAYELLSTDGLKVVPEIYTKGSLDGTPEPMTANHASIAKPENRDAEVYKWVRARIVGFESRPPDTDEASVEEPDYNLVDSFNAPYVVGTVFKIDSTRRPKIVDQSLVPLLNNRRTDQEIAGVIRGRGVWLDPLAAATAVQAGSEGGSIGFQLLGAQRIWIPEGDLQNSLKEQQLKEFNRSSQSSDTLLVNWRPRKGSRYFLATDVVEASGIVWTSSSANQIALPACESSSANGRKKCDFRPRVRVLFRGEPLIPIEARTVVRDRTALPRGVVVAPPPSLVRQGEELSAPRLSYDSVATSITAFVERNEVPRLALAQVLKVQEGAAGGEAVVRVPEEEGRFTPLNVIGQEWSNSVTLTEISRNEFLLRAQSWRGNPPRFGTPVRIAGRQTVDRTRTRIDSSIVRSYSPGPRLLGGAEVVIREQPGRPLELEFDRGGRTYRLSPSDTIEDDFFRLTAKRVLSDGTMEYRYLLKSQ